LKESGFPFPETDPKKQTAAVMNFVNLAILKYKIKLKILILARNNNHEAERSEAEMPDIYYFNCT